MIFHDRKTERRIINEYLNKSGYGMYILYGRRRIGKTYLLKYCTENKNGIFFTGRQVTGEYLLDTFSKQISDYMNIKGIHFKNWEEAFDFVYSNSSQIKYLVLDEFQYMVQASPEIPSILQLLSDHKKTDLKLFLCGSSISFMHGLLSYKNPLFGRKTNYMRLKPVKFSDVREFFNDFNELDYHQLLSYYSVFGGVPQYLKMLDSQKGFIENLNHMFLNIDSPLREEPLFLLSEELREPRIYHSILESISFGYNTSSEISSKIGFKDSRQIQPYLKTLEKLDLISRVVPITEKNPARTRKGIYKIKDNLFAFWFRFVYPNLYFIESDMKQKVLKEIETNISQYSSFIFEEEARNYVHEYFDFEKTGSYWDKSVEIDILSEKEGKWYAGECKWTNKKIGISEYKKLVEKTLSLKTSVEKYIFVSKNGFDESIKEIENVILIEFSKENGWNVL